MTRMTLHSPLGIAFRAFAFSTLFCAFTCYRAITFSWARSDPGLNCITRQISLESGALRTMQLSGNAPSDYARFAQRSGLYVDIRIPEPLGYQDGILAGMFKIKRENASRFESRMTIPIWPFTLLTLIPALRFAKVKYHERITRRRLRRGLCTGCGYDLRASPDRCPECGMVPVNAATPMVQHSLDRSQAA